MNLTTPGSIAAFSYDVNNPTYWQERLSNYILSLYKAKYDSTGQTTANTPEYEVSLLKSSVDTANSTLVNMEERLDELPGIKSYLTDIAAHLYTIKEYNLPYLINAVNLLTAELEALKIVISGLPDALYAEISGDIDELFSLITTLNGFQETIAGTLTEGEGNVWSSLNWMSGTLYLFLQSWLDFAEGLLGVDEVSGLTTFQEIRDRILKQAIEVNLSYGNTLEEVTLLPDA